MSMTIDHSDEIQMFDMPPPRKLWGIEACLKMWPPFFKWLKQGASFETFSLDVTAGVEVAFATALLRCGTEEELRKDPDNRLRLTLGCVRRAVAASSRTSTIPSRFAIDPKGSSSWPS
jgi:ketosteroid isomerase-like protein